MKALEINERPRTWLLWVSRLGLLFACVMLGEQLLVVMGLKSGYIDHALTGLLVMLFVSCLLGGVYKRVVTVDRDKRTLTTQHNLIFGFAKKVFKFDELSSVYVRKESVRSRGDGFGEQEASLWIRYVYVVIVDLKGFGKGRKRIRIKKFSDQQDADELAGQVAVLIR